MALRAADAMAYCSDADQLFFQWTDPSDSEPTFQITARIALPDGSVTTIQNQQKATGEIPSTRVAWPLPEGIIISLTVEVIAGFNSIGFWYVTAGILYGNATSGGAAQTLVSGYPAKDTILSWPGGTQAQPGDGKPGRITFGPTGNNPSPLFISPFPRSSRNYLNFAQFRITTSAAVGNRFAQCFVGTGGGGFRGPGWCSNTPIPPSSTLFCIFVPSALEVSQGGFLTVPIMEKTPLYDTDTIVASIINADAADRISFFSIDFEFWAGFNNP